MLPLISVLICNEYLQMTKVIREKKFQTICNIGQPKPWSQISGPGSGFMVLNLWSCLSDSGSWIWNLSLSSGSWIPFLRSCVLILVHSVNITKSDKNLLHSLIVIKKSDRKYKVWPLLRSMAIITKWDITTVLQGCWYVVTLDLKFILPRDYLQIKVVTYPLPIVTLGKH